VNGPALVGRDRELAELAAALARVPSSSGALFLLAGEPGIGKSRLAAEAANAALDASVTPAWGRCWEAGGAPVFWPWREACGSLGIRFPEAAEIAASDPEEARFALFREVASALARAAADKPLLIILEDLHAADRSTLLLLECVAGRLRTVPVMVIGTYRDLEARQRADVADSIARLGRTGRVLQLARLAAAHVGALVRDGIENADEHLVATVFETTQGNPLFVDEIVRDIRAHGQRSGLPLGVREVIRQRLSLLSPGALAALEVCAVLGVELARADVVRMLPDAPVLDEAMNSGVLVAQRDRLRFSHALYREALYFDLPAARRQSIHRNAARALALAGAPAAELAHHLLEAGSAAVVEAVDQAIRAAAQAVETFAFEDALAILERARGVIPPGPAETALRCRVLIAFGETKLRSGDATGRAACVDAAQAARSLGDAVLLAQAGLAYGSVFLMGGVDPVLVTMLEQALESLPDTDSPLRARVMARLAAARQPSAPAERGRDIELGLAAIAMARRVADRRDLLGVLHAASGVLYGKADPAVRLPISREQEALAEELGDTSRLLHALVRLAYDHLEQADFAGYAQLAAKYEQLSARVGAASAPWRVPLMRSMMAIAKDDFAASERWQEQARRLGANDPRARRAEAFHRLGYLRAAERHGELRAAIPELRGLWLAMPYGAVLADARVAQVLARIGADDELAAILAAMPETAFDEEINCTSLVDAMWATADVTLARRIEPLLEHLGDRWHAYWFDCEIAEVPRARAGAYLAAILGRSDESERLFARALASVEAVGRRSLAARMRYELGDLLLRLGRESERARELIALGRRDARAIGLGELVALIEKRHPWLEAEGVARSRTSHGAPRSAFAMKLEGEYYALPGARGTLRFKTSRGMQYLALLIDRPNTEVHVLQLVGAIDHPDRGDAGELVDPAALRAYRKRLDMLREELETAQALGNTERAERAREEMESIAAELTRTTQKGGRARRGASAIDRARSAVRRRIKDALDRITEQDPELGGWLSRSVSTGNYCVYRPDR
jgi:hypothetical protein